jgi:hypothetical protein
MHSPLLNSGADGMIEEKRSVRLCIRIFTDKVKIKEIVNHTPVLSNSTKNRGVSSAAITAFEDTPESQS